MLLLADVGGCVASEQDEALFETHIESDQEVGFAEVHVMVEIGLQAEVEAFELVLVSDAEGHNVAYVGGFCKCRRGGYVQCAVGVGRPELWTSHCAEIMVAVPVTCNGSEAPSAPLVGIEAMVFVCHGGVEGVAAVVQRTVFKMIEIEWQVESQQMVFGLDIVAPKIVGVKPDAFVEGGDGVGVDGFDFAAAMAGKEVGR